MAVRVLFGISRKRLRCPRYSITSDSATNNHLISNMSSELVLVYSSDDEESLTSTEEFEPLGEDEDLFSNEAEEEMPPPPCPFHLNCKNLFLTFPQCSESKEVAMASIISKLDPKWAIVAEESHKDGSPHLHCIVVLKKQRHFRNCKLFDTLVGKHGDYQSARDLVKVVSYVAKMSVYCAYHINVAEFLANAIKHKKQGKSKGSLVAAKVNDGASLRDIDVLFPAYFMMNKRKIEEYAVWSSLKRMRESKLCWTAPARHTAVTFPEEQDILFWVIKNIKTERQFKQEQLWLWGPRGTGKTSLIVWLEKYLTIYYVPYEDYDDDWEDGVYDLAVLDEFRGQRRITWMNRFVQGSCMRIRKKGSQGMKRENIPVIVLSNYCIQDAYSQNVPDIAKDTLKCRFSEIEIPHGEIVQFYNVL